MVETPSTTQISRPPSLVRAFLLSPVTALVGTVLIMAFLWNAIPH